LSESSTLFYIYWTIHKTYFFIDSYRKGSLIFSHKVVVAAALPLLHFWRRKTICGVTRTTHSKSFSQTTQWSLVTVPLNNNNQLHESWIINCLDHPASLGSTSLQKFKTTFGCLARTVSCCWKAIILDF